MAKDFKNGMDAINSMINDEPEEGTKKTDQKKKAVTFAFKIDPDIADLVRRYAFLKNKKVKPLKFNVPIACSKTDCFLHPD